MTTIFVTATGTDIGKTFVTSRLIGELRRRGRPVHALKPVVSGFEPDRAAASDPGMLLAALGRNITEDEVARISPWRFRAALSPNMAAAREGRDIDFNVLVAHCKQTAAECDGVLFIEGVGGIMVPLDNRHTVLDWMAALDCPLIVVAGSYLGAISHTLSAIDVLNSRGREVKALIVSETPESPVPLEETLDTIARFARTGPVLGLPRSAGGERLDPTVGRVADLL